MAPRQPRKPPQPPNRSRVNFNRISGNRKPNPAIKDIEEGITHNVTGRRFSPPPRRITPRSTTLEEAVEAFDAGDDSLLFQYDPTDTSNPARPRTQKAGYDRKTQQLRVMFREGAARGGETAIYVYYDVPPNVWRNFKRVRSPGKFINRVLNAYPYDREY